MTVSDEKAPRMSQNILDPIRLPLNPFRPSQGILGALLAILAAVSGCTSETVAVEEGMVDDPRFPYIISNKGSCSGALIAHDRVMTAAHCVADIGSWAVIGFGSHASRKGIVDLIRPEYDYAEYIMHEPVDFEPLKQEDARTAQDYNYEEIEMFSWGCNFPKTPMPLRKSGYMAIIRRGEFSLEGLPPAHYIFGDPRFYVCNGDSGSAVISITRGTIIGVLSGGFIEEDNKTGIVIGDINLMNMQQSLTTN